MGRSLSVTVGTIPGGTAPSRMVADGAGLTDAPSATLAGVRTPADPLGLTDAISVALSDPTYREGWGNAVFYDDFTGLPDGSAPNPAKWYRRGLPGSDYLLTNTDRQGVIQQANAYVQGGYLTLKTERRATPITADAYTRWYDTGYIDTRGGRFSQRYGLFECRAKSLHPGDTAGIWPAFWLRTDQDGGENDIFEWVGTPTGRDGDGVSQSYTYASRFPITGLGSFSAFFEETGQTNNTAGKAYHESEWSLPTADDWHTYSCVWTPDRMSNYCDGELMVEIRRGVQPRRNNGTINGSIADGALILDGGFGGSAQAHMRLSVHVGFPNVGFASPGYTVSPHYFLYDYVAAWAWSGQE